MPQNSTDDSIEFWTNWENRSEPNFLSVYIFNTTNPHEVASGVKPELQEVGPYVYEERRVKVEIELDEKSDTVTYREKVHYFFRPDLSHGTEEDNLKILNIPLLMLPSVGVNLTFSIKLMLKLTDDIQDLFHKALFMDISAGELLFKGVHLPMIQTAEERLGISSLLENHTFGLFYSRNGSDEGVWKIQRGMSNPAQRGRVVSWKGTTELGFSQKIRNEKHCNMINGTNGYILPPFSRRDKALPVFYPSLCRSVLLQYVHEVEARGIKCYRFAFPYGALFEDVPTTPENACSCVEPNRMNDRRKSWNTIQLSACECGAPILMSTPHFLGGSGNLANMTEGLEPDMERHSTFVDLEPNTGSVLRLHKRTQYNIDLTSDRIFRHFPSVPDIVYPILWTDESLYVDKH